ncbi:MAG: acyl-CoA thioesterase [Bacteroidia bacterium]|nr:acyl-CoA thioesterase [Bacteroidia bacterium]
MKEFSSEIIVRGFHIDVFGHTNNARYLEFLEIARWDALKPLIENGFFAKRNLGFVVVNINISYQNPSFINDVLIVKTQIKKINNKSTIVHQQVFNKKTNNPICYADVTFVLMNLETRKAIVIDNEIRSVFENL